MIENILEYLQNTPPTSPGMITILICVGAFVGFINTIAGMATVISYGLFMAMGLPLNIANGTTRVGVLAQFITSSIIFKKSGMLDLKLGIKAGIPIAVGSIAGAFLAAHVDLQVLEVSKGVLLPFMAVLLFLDGSKISTYIKKNPTANMTPVKFIIFLLIGMYGGFTHAGVGLLIIFGSVFFLGLDALRSNALKQLAVVIYTTASIVVFIVYQQINWEVALIYAIGNTIGGVLGSIASIKLGSRFIKIFVLITVFTLSFWFLYKQFI